MSLKKILMIIPTNTAGGAERVFSQLANYFSNEGVEVILVNFDSETNFYTIDPKVKYVKLGLEFRGKTKTRKIIQAPYIEGKRLVSLRRLIVDIKPDIVLPFCEMAELLTIPICLHYHVPFCVSVRNDFKEYYFYMKLLAKMTYKKAKLVVCQTEAARDVVLSSVNCRTIVISNPLDSSTYYENGIDNERRHIILNVGRLVSQKNQEMLIRAFSKIEKKFPEYELHIYGKGPLENNLRKYISDLGLQKRVLLKGVLNNAIKQNADASIFVMSSDYEGFPNTLVEAMANKIPVISTNFETKAAEELLKEGECGWLVEVGNANQLALAMEDVLMHREDAERKANNGLYVRKYLHSDYICGKWLNEIEKVLEE